MKNKMETGQEMGKDRSEKYLEAFPDVFADIINAFLFGRKVISPEALRDGPTEAVYKAEDGERLKEQRRDVSKYVEGYQTVISLIGIENQTQPDADMVFRVMGYDYSNYRSQIDSGKERYPVITAVLYFGDQPWKKPCSIKAAVSAPGELSELLSDYRIHVIDIPRIPDRIRSMLTSDFAVVADYFANRHKPDFIPSKQELKHVEAVLKLLEVFGDKRYQEIEEEILAAVQRGEKVTMCEFYERVTDQALEKGIKEGLEKGIQQGMEQGIQQGMEKGIQQGMEQGIRAGLEKGIQALILDNLEFGLSKEQILEKLQKRFSLTAAEAQNYYEQTKSVQENE